MSCDNNSKLLQLFIVVTGLVSVVAACLLIPTMIHDDPIINKHFENAKMQYFLESDNNMSNKEKYEMMETICNERMSNNALNDELWFDSLTDEQLRIEKCIKLLMG